MQGLQMIGLRHYRLNHFTRNDVFALLNTCLKKWYNGKVFIIIAGAFMK